MVVFFCGPVLLSSNWDAFIGSGEEWGRMGCGMKWDGMVNGNELRTSELLVMFAPNMFLQGGVVFVSLIAVWTCGVSCIFVDGENVTFESGGTSKSFSAGGAHVVHRASMNCSDVSVEV